MKLEARNGRLRIQLGPLRIKRAAFEKQLRKGEGDARQLQDQLREIDAQIAALEEAVVNDASRDA